MSELAPNPDLQSTHTPEHQSLDTPENRGERNHPAHEGHEHHERSEQQKTAELAAIRQSIEHAAAPTRETAVDPAKATPEQKPLVYDRAAREQGYKAVKRHIRPRLSASERSLDKFMDRPVVKAVSEVGAKTVARPSGLLSGGFCAFLGTSIFFYIAHHIGFSYNYLLFSFFFIGGFAVGLVIEALLAVVGRLFGRAERY